MKLKDYCAVRFETEVWDEQVDVYPPVYVYEDRYYDDTEEDHFLFLLEDWFLNLEVTTAHDDVCCVDVFSAIKQNWRRIVKMMKKTDGYERFLSSYGDDIYDDDDAIASIADDVFKTLSQGYYGCAEDFCRFLGLNEKRQA